MERYLTPYVHLGMSPAARLHQTTFLPATLGLGSDLDVVICGKDGPYAFAYLPNQGFDRDQKGYIAVGDLQAAIDRACQGLRWDEITPSPTPASHPNPHAPTAPPARGRARPRATVRCERLPAGGPSAGASQG